MGVYWMSMALWVVCSGAFGANPKESPSVHLYHMDSFSMDENQTVAYPPSDPTAGPDKKVYGYLAYWANDLDTVPWDHLSHIALFAAGVDTAGVLSDTSRWGDIEQALNYAKVYDVKVHLTVVNFNTAELGVLLGSVPARQALIDSLATIVDETGVDGVNIDFEGLPSSRRSEMTAFVADLDAVVDEVVLATPAVDWSDAWDYASLTENADLFIMGYGYHWTGSSYAGPVDPLYGGGPWSPYSLEWTALDYLETGADPERIIMGLPLYGNHWPTADNSVPAESQGTGSSITWAAAHAKAVTYGYAIEPVSQTPYYFDGTQQGWYGTAETVQSRIQVMVELGLGGVGFWALNYDGQDAALWQGVYTETHMEPVVEDPVARVNDDQVVYVGDTVQLDGLSSTGPDPLDFLWTQVDGPPVQLDDVSGSQPSFVVDQAAVFSFELQVASQEWVSNVARLHVVALNKGDGEFRHPKCGCAAPTGLSMWSLGVGLFLVGLRSRRGVNR